MRHEVANAKLAKQATMCLRGCVSGWLQGAKLSSGQGKEEAGGGSGGTGARRFREVQLQEPIR